MSNKLFVGNISYDATDDSLKAAFEEVGEVVSAKIIMDKFTGRSKGFGFVEMASEELAAQAKEEMDGKELEGRKIFVDEARPQQN